MDVAESIPQSQGNAPIETEPMIKNTTHSSIGCNGMANNDEPDAWLLPCRGLACELR